MATTIKQMLSGRLLVESNIHKLPQPTSKHSPDTAHWNHREYRMEFKDTKRRKDTYLRLGSGHFPMQNWLKTLSSRSSVEVLPTISPTALTAMRRSMAASSNSRP